MKIYDIIQSIADTSSTKAKQQIMEFYKDDEILKMCFLYAENPRFNFWVKSALTTTDAGYNELSLLTFADLDRLINREITGNDAREFIDLLMHGLTHNARIILSRIINKDLRCGAGTSIANKVWKNLIPEYPCMLCGKYDAKAEAYLKKFEGKNGLVVALKADGGRLIAKVSESGNVTYHSRNGSTLDLYGVFDAQLSKFPGMVFDGELIVKTADGKPDRKRGNGFYTKAVRNTLTPDEAQNFTYVTWDIVSEVEYNTKGTVQYIDRYNTLVACEFSGNIEVIETEIVDTLDQCLEFYARMREADQEGAIIKVASAVWEDARSKNSVKLKNVSDIDAICVGFEYGSGKNSGKIGNLKCEDSTGMLKFNVGTGLTDADRERDPEYYIGSIIECSYNEVISAKGRETKSLFLPVYKQVRLDLCKANSLDDLK